MLHSEVIFKSMTGPDNTDVSNKPPGMSGLSIRTPSMTWPCVYTSHFLPGINYKYAEKSPSANKAVIHDNKR